jgi:hypothetical protein
MMRGSTFWGLVLVVIGVLFLLNSLGLLAVNVWSLIWPIFLIVLGVWFVWGAFFGRSRVVRQEEAAIPLEGATRASIRLSHGAGRLHIRSGSSGDRLLDGTFGGGLDHRSKKDGDALDVRMRIRSGDIGMWGPWSWQPGMLDWDFSVNPDVPLALDLETGASDNILDFSNLKVNELNLKTGASSTEVMLPLNAGQTRVAIHAGAASVSLRVPASVAARIRVHGGLAGKEIDTGRFPRSGDVYQSPDYETAPNKVDVDAELGAGSIQVR